MAYGPLIACWLDKVAARCRIAFVISIRLVIWVDGNNDLRYAKISLTTDP